MGRATGVLVALLLPAMPAAATSNIKVGSFAKSTSAAPTTQNVAHGLGQPPVALIFWTVGKTNGTFSNDYLWAVGISDLTTEKSFSAASQSAVATSNASRRLADKAITIVQWGATTLAEASVSAVDSTNFTLNWSTNDANATIVHFIAIGGDAHAKVVAWTAPSVTGNKAVTGVGFTPQAVLNISAGGITAAPPTSGSHAAVGLGAMDASGGEWAIATLSVSGSGTSDTQRVQVDDASLIQLDNTASVAGKASFVSMDTDGFTMNFSAVPGTSTNYRIASLALSGIRAKAGTFAKTTAAATASQSVTGVGFTPKALLLASDTLTAGSGASADGRFGIGSTDGSTQGAAALSDADAVGTTDAEAIDSTTKTFIKVNDASQTINAQCTTTSLDPDGFTLSWTTNDAVATEICYLALAPRRVMVVRAPRRTPRWLARRSQSPSDADRRAEADALEPLDVAGIAYRTRR